MKKLNAVIIGAGNRGSGYAHIMLNAPDCFQVVGVAEPLEDRRNAIRDMFAIPEENCFLSWEQLLDRPRFADFAIISTQDAMHYEPAMKAIALGYDLLLEKPMAPTPEECKKLAIAAKEKGTKIVVCHVLRYTPLFKEVKRLIMEGEIGEVMSVSWLEPVGIKHMSHSFVRGNWRNKEESSPMILAKSCHDLDAVQWLVGQNCTKVHSFGSLRYFRSENKPEGAPERCIDGCPHAEACPFDTAKLYQGADAMGGGWFRGAATNMVSPTEEDVERALRTTSYGKCVFSSDNNVVDHQVVNLEFDNSATVSFSMSAFNGDGRGREFKIFGTKGFIEVYGKNDFIYLTRFADHKDGFANKISETIDVRRIEDKDGISITSGHGGGDGGIINAIYYEFNNAYEGYSISTADDSYKNHLLSFAAEESRLSGKVMDMIAFAEDIQV